MPAASQEAVPADTAPSEPSASSDSADQPQARSEDNRSLTADDIPAEAFITAQDLQQMRESEAAPFIVDVRANGDFIGGFIPEARNIPAGRTFDIRMDEVPGDQLVVIVDRQNDRAAEVRQTLLDAGYSEENLKVLEGGMKSWFVAGYETDFEEDLGC